MTQPELKVKTKIWFAPTDLSRGEQMELSIDKIGKKFIYANGFKFERFTNGYAIGFKMESPEGFIYPSKEVYEDKIAWDMLISGHTYVSIPVRSAILRLLREQE
ncbi:hypothetical protein [Comamonas sp.]|uniref:hypothetical protein n=1 Tax=Comamonas sp. TaxID=34028 RepID=UPI0012C344A1|nr:hypothetical protein [Comamonas sp.]MPS92904.1 hypothetical protein [Comamonas sp.]